MTDLKNAPAVPVPVDGDDPLAPMLDLVLRLELLGVPRDADDRPGIIQTTALELTRSARIIILALGGTSVVTTFASGVWAEMQRNTVLAVACVSSMGVVLAAAALGIAKIVGDDTRGRSLATTEQIRARAVVASTYVMTAARRTPGDGAAGAPPAFSIDDFERMLATYGAHLGIVLDRPAG